MALTPEQLSVIRHENGHAKVMAVAGAGKTTTLVYFVRQCLTRGLQPRRILVLMYNKAAQEDFQAKLRQLLSKGDSSFVSIPEVRTFHSLGLRIYKQLIQMGLLPVFNQRLLSDGEIESEVWRLLQACSDPETAKDILDQKSKWVEPAVSFIDLVKSTLRSPEEVFESSGLPRVCHFFPKVFHKFESWRKQQARISFSDMLYDPCCFLSKNSAVAQQFSGHMQQIIVDEYQDINEIQQFLLTMVRGDRGDLMVVGDPDQTIYEFRGSRPEFMTTEFDHAFEGVTLYNLSNTFRYGHRLSLLCNFLIEKNPDRKGVLCLSHSQNPDTKIYLDEYDDYSKQVIHTVRQYSGSLALSQIAILNRIWAISAPIELALLEHDIPYTLDHSVSVLDRKELASFEALLLIASGQYSGLTVEHKTDLLITLLTQPFPKIRRKVLLQIAQLAAQFGDQPGKSIRSVMPDNLSNRQADQLLARSRLLDQSQTDRFTSDQLLQKFFNITDMEEGIRDSAFSAQQVDDRLETVRAFMRYFRGLQLPSKDGWSHWQSLREKRQSSNVDGVKLTSMHRAKGLEWPCVIIPALSQRFMPYQPEGELTVPSSIESERRLMYVAMTRAKSFLHILVPKSSGSDSSANSDLPSPFVSEMAFETSDVVGASLSKGTNSTIKVPVKNFQMAADYCLNVNIPQTLEMIDEPESLGAINRATKAISSSSSKRQMSPKVRHQVYGEGVILADEKKYWIIKFETGIEKQFDKRVASQYLEFL
ncbi:ATP-dependent helicase [Litoribrevibacter albus]|uniref:DNA 3'-5' helicase n=1 Tax=Litoribrevibacter albus TaxID=1473156 RepID=A0AA37SAR9_9GAMM|nr:ATP-dependent helicase [Litoribrevibacter albus]GLQ31786.1 DNA helicase [Litoribrevibacter albus]